MRCSLELVEGEKREGYQKRKTHETQIHSQLEWCDFSGDVLVFVILMGLWGWVRLHTWGALCDHHHAV